MNKLLIKASLMIMLAVPMGAVAAPITYDINFKADIGEAPTSGSFIYDADSEQLTGSEVVWSDIEFKNFVFSGSECGGGDAGAFALLSQSCATESVYQWNGVIGPSGTSFAFVQLITGDSLVSEILQGTRDTRLASGTWKITPSTSQVPEPGSLALLGLGLAGMGFARCRKAA